MIIGISGRIGSGKDLIGNIIQYFIYKKYYEDVVDIVDYINMPKDDNGLAIIHYVPEKFHIKKFADTLKDIVCLLIGCTREQLEDHEFKNTELGDEWKVYYWSYYKFKSKSNPLGRTSQLFISNEEATEYKLKNSEFDWGIIKSSTLESYILTPRLLLQILGTDCGRKLIHPNIWINSLFSNYRPLDDTKRSSMGNVIDYSDCPYPNWIITDLRFPNELEAIKKRQGISIRVNRTYSREPIYIQGEELSGTSRHDWEQAKPQHESETALDNETFDYIINNSGTIEDLVESVKIILIKENIL